MRVMKGSLCATALGLFALVCLSAGQNPVEIFNPCLQGVLNGCAGPAHHAQALGQAVESCAWPAVAAQFPNSNIYTSVSVVVSMYPNFQAVAAANMPHQLELDGFLATPPAVAGNAEDISHLVSAKLNPGAVPGSFAGDIQKLACMLDPNLDVPPHAVMPVPHSVPQSTSANRANLKTHLETCFPNGLANNAATTLWKLVTAIQIVVTDSAGATHNLSPAQFRARFAPPGAGVANVGRIGITTRLAAGAAPPANHVYFTYLADAAELGNAFTAGGC